MLEQTDIAVATLINKFNEVTPQLMQTFKQQIQVAIVTDILGICLSAVVLMLSIIGIIWSLRLMQRGNDAGMLLIAFSIVFSLVSVVLMICIGFDLIQLNLNPDYYILDRYIKPLLS